MTKKPIRFLCVSAALCALAFLQFALPARGQDDLEDLIAEINGELDIINGIDDLLLEPAMPDPGPNDPEPAILADEPDFDDMDLDLAAQEPVAEPVEQPAPVAEPDDDEAALDLDALTADLFAAPEDRQPAPEPEPVLDEPTVVEPEMDIPLAIEPVLPAEVRRELDPRETEIMLMKDSEELRRLAYERHAKESMTAAERAFINRQFHLATRRYTEAINAFREAGYRAENEVDRMHAQAGMRESIYQEAVELRRQGNYENAAKLARQALGHGHPLAGDLLALIQKDQEPKDEPPPPPQPQRWKQTELQQREQDLAQRLVQAQEFMLTGELDRAQRDLESVMKRDPYNTEAMRLMEKIARRRDDIATMELEYTRRYMIADVRKAWNRRDYAVDEDVRLPDKRPIDGITPPDRIITDRMKKIEIPEIDFRQANIHDVVSFLQGASVEFEQVPEGVDQLRRGVNIILNLGTGEPSAAARPVEMDQFGFGTDFGQPDADAPGGDVPLITFSARYISLYEALRLVTQIAGLKFRVEGSVVMIVPLNAPDGDIIHRSYDVQAAFIDVVQKTEEELRLARPGADFGRADMGMGAPGGARLDMRELFRQMGVQWPTGSFIRHVPSIGKLMVANTANNLAIFEEKLSLLNVVPNQIEIEARFVEVRQTDMMSLGFEWGLTDNWQIAHRTDVAGGPGLADRPHILMRENMAAGGFTKGNRFLRDALGGDPVPDDVFTIASVLTNPELAFTLHMLQQKGNMDLLSAPKVTTQSGQEATIKVVTEYIYPTSFSVEPITAGSGDDIRIVGGIVEPSGFQTREVGVILSVMPEVSAEGNLINLTMTPEVVTEPMWKNYGSVYTDPSGNEQRLNMEQPFFHTRSITTQIMIFNGATVVMGGMINEQRTEVDDKIPFLGDLPLLGRLFRSRSENSEKRNLLIFVTARLVDPAGRVIQRRQEALTQEGEVTAP